MNSSNLAGVREHRMKTWDRTKPHIYDPKLGKPAVPAPHIPPQESAKPLKSSKKKRKAKSKSTSVWSVPGGLPETNRRRH